MTLRSQICEHTFCFYYELGMYMLNRRMFQRGKDNKYFWFHEQSNIFFHVKVYLCYIKENSMTVNEARLIYFSPTHTSKQVAEAIVHGTGQASGCPQLMSSTETPSPTTLVTM